jgi:hypothetical protein
MVQATKSHGGYLFLGYIREVFQCEVLWHQNAEMFSNENYTKLQGKLYHARCQETE